MTTVVFVADAAHAIAGHELLVCDTIADWIADHSTIRMDLIDTHMGQQRVADVEYHPDRIVIDMTAVSRPRDVKLECGRTIKSYAEGVPGPAEPIEVMHKFPGVRIFRTYLLTLERAWRTPEGKLFYEYHIEAM